jgi:hypothetical protein
MLDLFGDLLKIIIPFYFIVEGAAAGAVRYQKAKGPSESEPTASETASASAHDPGGSLWGAAEAMDDHLPTRTVPLLCDQLKQLHEDTVVGNSTQSGPDRRFERLLISR